MTCAETRSSDFFPRRRNKFIIASIIFVALSVVAIVRCLPEIDYELLRRGAKTSFVLVIDNKQQSAFSLNEEQTNKMLDAIGRTTEPCRNRQAVIFHTKMFVFCKDSKSAHVSTIWVHPKFGTESDDVIEKLFELARHGVAEDPNSDIGLRDDAHQLERVY